MSPQARGEKEGRTEVCSFASSSQLVALKVSGRSIFLLRESFLTVTIFQVCIDGCLTHFRRLAFIKLKGIKNNLHLKIYITSNSRLCFKHFVKFHS